MGYRGSGGLPYEFRALEAALTSVSSALEEEMSVHREAVESLIGPLETHIGEFWWSSPSSSDIVLNTTLIVSTERAAQASAVLSTAPGVSKAS
jgi:hypothetical protein